MALSSESVPIRVRAYLASRGADVSGLRNPRILALVPDALRELVTKGQLRKTFAISAVSGTVSLAAALADAEPLILEEIRKATVTFDNQTYPMQWKADRSSLMLPASVEFVYGAIEDTTLLVADESGLGHFTDDGDIRNASFVATLSSVTAGLESIFIQTLVRLLSADTAVATTNA